MWLESHLRKAKQLSSPLNIVSVYANKMFMDGAVYSNWPLVNNVMVCCPHLPLWYLVLGGPVFRIAWGVCLEIELKGNGRSMLNSISYVCFEQRANLFIQFSLTLQILDTN